MLISKDLYKKNFTLWLLRKMFTFVYKKTTCGDNSELDTNMYHDIFISPMTISHFCAVEIKYVSG